MAGDDGFALFLGETAEVHEAAHIERGDDVGFGLADVFEFQLAHAFGDVRETHAESAAEAAALLALAEGQDCNAGDGSEELGGGVAALGAARVAGTVEGDAGVELAGPFGDAEAVDDVITKLPSAVA